MIEILIALICACTSATGPYSPAVRIDTPEASTPVTCDQTANMVNNLTYEWGNMEPARVAYQAVAISCMGWTQDQIDRWEPFIVDDVIKEESGGCWNILRKAVWNGQGCDFRYPNGAAEDAGFFQLISIWYGPDGYLCTKFGTCGYHSIIDSPYTSMVSGLRAIEHDGSRPWCYDARARAFHTGCAVVPRNFN